MSNLNLLLCKLTSCSLTSVNPLQFKKKKKRRRKLLAVNQTGFIHMCCVCMPSHVQLFATPWSVASQAPLAMKFSRQEHWSGLPFLPPGDLPHQRIKPASLAFPALAGGFFTTVSPGKPCGFIYSKIIILGPSDPLIFNYRSLL